MRRLSFLLALLVVPGVAQAKKPPRIDGPDSAEIAGPVEVPLYRGGATHELPAVWAQFPKATPEDGEPVPGTLAVIDLCNSVTKISKGTAKALGLKVKDKTDNVVVPTVKIGDLVLHDVEAAVAEGNDFVLGAAQIPGVATAIFESKGTVKFVPAAQADALLAEVGPAIEATRNPYAKWWEHGSKRWGNGIQMTVAGNLLGTDGRLRLATAMEASLAAESIALDGRWIDGVEEAIGEPTAGGVALGQAWVRHDGSIADPSGQLVGVAAMDVLWATDLAVDPTKNVVAIKKIAEAKPQDPRVPQLEDARAGFAWAEKKAADKPADDSESAASEGVDPGKADVFGRELPLADALRASALWDEALQHYKAAAAVAGDNCAPYQSYGEALLASGNAKDAVAPLTKAAELWDRWYAQDLDTRSRLQAKKKAKGAEFALVQPSSCFTAWGSVAAAQLALGQHEEVAKIHAAHTDLDPNVPLAYGMSLLAQGQLEPANGPIREALNLQGRPGDSQVRMALGWAHASSSDWEVFVRQVKALSTMDDAYWFVALLPAIEGVRKVQGDASALGLAQQLVSDDPLSAQAKLLLARELHRTGDAAGMGTALGEVDALLIRQAGRWPNDSVAPAYRAVATALRGDTAAANAALDQVNTAYGASAVYYMARGLVASIAGDAAAADRAMADLRLRGPLLTVSLVDLTPGG